MVDTQGKRMMKAHSCRQQRYLLDVARQLPVLPRCVAVVSCSAVPDGGRRWARADTGVDGASGLLTARRQVQQCQTLLPLPRKVPADPARAKAAAGLVCHALISPLMPEHILCRCMHGGVLPQCQTLVAAAPKEAAHPAVRSRCSSGMLSESRAATGSSSAAWPPAAARRTDCSPLSANADADTACT